MIIGIQGSRNFKDYTIFLRAMGTALHQHDGTEEFTIISAGPHKVNEMALEFINVSNWKSRGIKAKVVKMPAIALKERIQDLDYFIYFSLPKETESDLVREAQDKDVEVGIYRYA